jgi:hypothetical protein
MSYDHDNHHERYQDDEPPSYWRTRYGIGLLVLGAVAAYFLLTEHLAHVAQYWPFAFLLACPLMHLFMHHGHGHGHDHQGHQDHDGSARRPQNPASPSSDRSSSTVRTKQGDL